MPPRTRSHARAIAQVGGEEYGGSEGQTAGGKGNGNEEIEEVQEDREIEEIRKKMKKKKKKTKKGERKEVHVEEGDVQGRDDASEGIGMAEEMEPSVQPQIRVDEEGSELQVFEEGVQQEDDARDKAVMEVDEEANKDRNKKKKKKKKKDKKTEIGKEVQVVEVDEQRGDDDVEVDEQRGDDDVEEIRETQDEKGTGEKRKKKRKKGEQLRVDEEGEQLEEHAVDDAVMQECPPDSRRKRKTKGKEVHDSIEHGEHDAARQQPMPSRQKRKKAERVTMAEGDIGEASVG